MAKCYENGVFLDKNDEKRVEYFTKLANEGEHRGHDSWIKGAQYELARYYKSIKDIEKTIFWAEKCIDGCWEKDILSKARFLLANLYAVNGEIEKVVPLLVKIFKGNVQEREKIKAELSNMKEKHNVKLEEYFEKELDDQNRQFCYEVGKMYYMGELLEQNTENAHKWLKISAEEPDGNDFAKYGVAEIYEKLGEKEKAIEAYKHFIKKNSEYDFDKLCSHAEKAILRLTDGGNEDDFSIFNFKRETWGSNDSHPF